MWARTWALLWLAVCGPAALGGAAPKQDLVLKVLQTDQLFDSTRSGKLESRVSCSISGSPSPAVEASRTSILGAEIPWVSNAYPGLSMHCSGQGQSVGWRHVLNAALVVASDGNAYVLACEAAFRWSKCQGLRTGDVFRASRSTQGLTVFAAEPNGKAAEIDYHILSSKSLTPEPVQAPPTSGPATSGPAKTQNGPEKTQASGTGTVTIFSSQLNAEIYVDGKFAGNPPVMLDLPEGSHDFEVKSEGFSVWERKLDVRRNSAVTLNATLTKAP